MNIRERSALEHARSLVPLLVCLSPLFWFMELFQNQLYHWVEGRYGWLYPASKYSSFYFPSLLLWASAIAVIWTLDTFAFIPRGTPQWRRVPLLALACWAGEWLAGFAGDRVGLPMQLWTDSPLKYIRPSAYWFWCLDVLCYDWLLRWMRSSGADWRGSGGVVLVPDVRDRSGASREASAPGQSPARGYVA